ncbi:AbrB/MazE/SpoVT family DNA-binding domain-containing protein [Bacillus solitudinis]|uniref:AbrB/MazE/SpoVT family DNA-binding domain-containing protein n=1 Tax=Bacillus solitudinis TaxID=2014074 RepID=UPI000C24B4D7|nr:AbrB/MazE/SpoVT family DNA-binding domain-containing protein [Bacillus solitudinis]
MSEVFTSQNPRLQIIDTGLKCTIKSGYYVTIPKSIRKSLTLGCGDEVAVGLTGQADELMIQKLHGETLNNKMIISEKGAIRIPIELRRILKLEKEDSFYIFLEMYNKALFLKRTL